MWKRVLRMVGMGRIGDRLGGGTIMLDDVDGGRSLDHRHRDARSRSSLRSVRHRRVVLVVKVVLVMGQGSGVFSGVFRGNGGHTVAVLVQQRLMLLEGLTIQGMRHRF